MLNLTSVSEITLLLLLNHDSGGDIVVQFSVWPAVYHILVEVFSYGYIFVIINVYKRNSMNSY